MQFVCWVSFTAKAAGRLMLIRVMHEVLRYAAVRHSAATLKYQMALCSQR